MRASRLGGRRRAGDCLARWGTRTFWRQYCTQRFLPEKGLDGTSALAEDGRVFLTQTLNAGSFCVGLSASGTPPLRGGYGDAER